MPKSLRTKSASNSALQSDAPDLADMLMKRRNEHPSPTSLADLFPWSAGPDTIDAVVTSWADHLGEPADPILRAIYNNEPVGRFVSKLLGLERSRPRLPGRPREPERRGIIIRTVDDLIASGMTEAEAFKAAPEALAKQAVYGTQHMSMTVASARRAYKKAVAERSNQKNSREP